MCVYNNLERRDGKPTFALQAMSTLCLPCESIWCAIVGLTFHPLDFRLNSRDHIRGNQSTTYVSDSSFNLTPIRINEAHRSKSRRQEDTNDIVHCSIISDRARDNSDDYVGHTFEDPKLYDTYICSRSQIGTNFSRLSQLLKAKIEFQNRAPRVSAITVQLRGGFSHIAFKRQS
jgi:hypothetical protein